MLTEVNRECRYKVISDTAAEEINLRIDADKVFEELFQACPELKWATAAAGSGDPKGVSEDVIEFASVAPSFPENEESSAADTTDSAGTGGGTDTGTSDTAGESGGGDTSNGSSGGDTSNGSSGGDSASSEGGSDDSNSKDSGSNDRGTGSNANNGGGNGSEGSSPGRGKGANQDE